MKITQSKKKTVSSDYPKTNPMKPYLLILLTLCTLGCDKTDPDPTPSYTSGYYFYCKVDGEEFHPEFKSELGYKNIEAKLLENSTSLYIHGDLGFRKVGLSILDSNTIEMIPYDLSVNIDPFSRARYKKDLSTNTYRTDSTHTGQVIITNLDKNSQIVTGTFHFDAYNSATDDTVHITDGVFNLYYETY